MNVPSLNRAEVPSVPTPHLSSHQAGLAGAYHTQIARKLYIQKPQMCVVMERGGGGNSNSGGGSGLGEDNRCACGRTLQMVGVHVTPTTGGQFELRVASTDSIEFLRRLVSKRLRVPKERICLLYRDR
ncbi:Midnolin [Portunus trituberculatus]|uniref:Midnolin n=1 Tax=Portunus trituberculatus TaxID=210409 RepID=A0A5B7J6S7_PORTR|nr:Midnolin [Portunus trituberculatus]